MPLTDTLVLDSNGGTDVTYVLVGRRDNGSTRIDQSTDLVQPRTLVINHYESTNKDKIVTDRHVVQIKHVLINAKGQPVELSIGFTIAVPRDVIVTKAHVLSSVSQLLDFLQDSTLATWTATQNVESLLIGNS